jgi:RNA polymerase sigma-70 factor (ECF subfamily)
MQTREVAVRYVEVRTRSRYVPRVPPSNPLAAPVRTDDTRLVQSLRAGDEAAFAMLVAELSPSMLRMARMYVSTRAVAEEVVQEAWLGVLRGLERFEGRSSLKTWIFRILTNTAKTRGEREGRTVPFSALAGEEVEADDPAVDADRFRREGRWTGHWSEPPADWGQVPEARLLGNEARAVIDQAVAALPPAQATVIRLRDIEGFDAGDVCNVLEISETNQRVLLHRARSKVRRALEDYLGDTGD